MSDNRADGCTRWCCSVTRLVDIPPKPASEPWVDYAPHLTGRQIMRLSQRWSQTTKTPQPATGR